MLAREVTTLVHGADEAASGRACVERAVRRGHHDAARCDDVLAVFDDVPSTELSAARVRGEGMASSTCWRSVGLAASKSEARRLVQRRRRLREQSAGHGRDERLARPMRSAAS